MPLSWQKTSSVVSVMLSSTLYLVVVLWVVGSSREAVCVSQLGDMFGALRKRQISWQVGVQHDLLLLSFQLYDLVYSSLVLAVHLHEL